MVSCSHRVRGLAPISTNRAAAVVVGDNVSPLTSARAVAEVLGVNSQAMKFMTVAVLAGVMVLSARWEVMLHWPASRDVAASRSNQDGLQGSPVVYISGVMPADFSLPRSVMRSAQVAGGDVIPALRRPAAREFFGS